MKPNHKLFTSFLLLVTFFSATAQDNSPWKKYVTQTVSGVLIAPGCHEYSLTNGQGFSVYLRNDNTQAVTVTGLLTAKTVCGNLVTTKFNVMLEAGQIASGNDYDKGSQNGQTSVVTPLDCIGTRYIKNIRFVNRISNLTASDIRVTPVSGSTFASKPTVSSMIKESVPVASKFDSLVYYRTRWGYTKDSLLSEIYTLKIKNKSLLDTINYKTFINNSLNTQLTEATTKKKKRRY
ncbi:MAG: hypothetical protein H7101_01170 [Deinococcales bacterium]|nr:hypothetical protein [Chitinophagaceae bacterium]